MNTITSLGRAVVARVVTRAQSDTEELVWAVCVVLIGVLLMSIGYSDLHARGEL